MRKTLREFSVIFVPGITVCRAGADYGVSLFADDKFFRAGSHVFMIALYRIRIFPSVILLIYFCQRHACEGAPVGQVEAPQPSAGCIDPVPGIVEVLLIHDQLRCREKFFSENHAP